MAVTRFAPSPTGLLHLGHAWSALLGHDLARSSAGLFRLRIDDIDAARSREEHVAALKDDLDWLGLVIDGPVVHQSTRIAEYRAALTALQDRGLAYPCFCTRAEIAAEIAASAHAPHGADGPLYPGTCRGLSPATRDLFLSVARPHAWRIDMAAASAVAGPLDWVDGDGAVRRADPLAHGDIILARRDAASAYHLASTIDDADMGITHVVRGEDLRPATDIHRLLQALLGLPTPVYVHHPLIGNIAGVRLAKRDRAATLAEMRRNGADPAHLLAELRAGRLPLGYCWVSA